MTVEAPRTEEPLSRAKQANDVARRALEGFIADANASGWASDEMIAAIAEAARQMKDAILRDPDPAEDPEVSDIPPDGGQVGHGEMFD